LAEARIAQRRPTNAMLQYEYEAQIAKLQARLTAIESELTALARLYEDQGFADLEVTGYPIGLDDLARRGLPINGNDFIEAIEAYRQSLTRTHDTGGLERAEGPIEFVITSAGPGLMVKAVLKGAALGGGKAAAAAAAEEAVAAGIVAAAKSAAPKELGRFARAKQFGLQAYDQLRKQTAGQGLRAHHLIEKRFATLLGVDQKKMLSIALTPKEHQIFTNQWRNLIPYGNRTRRATRDEVLDAAREIYKNYPGILKALGL